MGGGHVVLGLARSNSLLAHRGVVVVQGEGGVCPSAARDQHTFGPTEGQNVQGRGPIGASKGKQTNTMALCQTPPPSYLAFCVPLGEPPLFGEACAACAHPCTRAAGRGIGQHNLFVMYVQTLKLLIGCWHCLSL